MTTVIDASFLERWSRPARIKNGATLCIRPLRADDREREVAFLNSLSDQSRYFRLFTPLKVLPRHLVDQLMDIDYRQRMAFVATTTHEGVEQFVGVARYGEADEPTSAEFAVSVADAWQRCGIARLLFEPLMHYAYELGIRRFTGIVLPDNRAMIALAQRLGFSITFDPVQHLFQISRELTDAKENPVAA